LLLGLLFVLFAEALQFYTKLGAFDVDDIILNMSAIFLGYLPVGIAAICRGHKKKRKK
jgi:glycopeptide antibiotics resistance protein